MKTLTLKDLHLKKIANSELTQLERRKHDAVLSAVELFSQKDYARVVVLLEPFEELLTKVEKAKLDFSKKRISQT